MNLRGEVPKLISYNDSKRMWCGTVRHIVPPNSIAGLLRKEGTLWKSGEGTKRHERTREGLEGRNVGKGRRENKTDKQR